ncbi:hypothetical protein BS78_02G143000 [Paspalum vaginatum]|nr:hypothetical protein BS78_02G143000 [Paspalum vaginatum]
MGRRLSAAVFVVTTLMVAALLLRPAGAQKETDDQLAFSYVAGAENGPERWGEIKPEWAICGNGSLQSPIDLSYGRGVPTLGYLDPAYRPAEATIVNRGHDIMLRFDGDAGSLVINGTAYHLSQLHWHTPSEHAVDGRAYDMELHMVHYSAEGKAAVVAFLYTEVAIGGHDAFLQGLEPFIRRIAGNDDQQEQRVGAVDPRGVRGFPAEYYRYMGSLTTPPCTEGVVWTVVKEVNYVRTVSSDQLRLLRQAVHDGMQDNARPLQKANNRDISIFMFTRLRDSF